MDNIITLKTLKRIVDQASKKYNDDIQIELDSFPGMVDDEDRLKLLPSKEWPYNLVLTE